MISYLRILPSSKKIESSIYISSTFSSFRGLYFYINVISLPEFYFDVSFHEGLAEGHRPFVKQSFLFPRFFCHHCTHAFISIWTYFKIFCFLLVICPTLLLPAPRCSYYCIFIVIVVRPGGGGRMGGAQDL